MLRLPLPLKCFSTSMSQLPVKLSILFCQPGKVRVILTIELHNSMVPSGSYVPKHFILSTCIASFTGQVVILNLARSITQNASALKVGVACM